MGDQEIRSRNCLRAIISGTDAWGEFWDCHNRLILYELHRLEIVPGQMREDIFQELVLKLISNNYRALRRFLENQESTSFSAYLRVILRSVAFTLIKKSTQTSNLELSLEEYQYPIELSDNWSRNPALRLEQERDFENILLSLTGNDRNSESFRILHLRFVASNEVYSIANQLGLKPNTVSQRIRYYINRARELYGEGTLRLRDD